MAVAAGNSTFGFKFYLQMLILSGAGSPFLTTANYLVERLPNCRGRWIPEAKHRAPEENPEGFVAAVGEFLESLQPAEKCETCT